VSSRRYPHDVRSKGKKSVAVLAALPCLLFRKGEEKQEKMTRATSSAGAFRRPQRLKADGVDAVRNSTSDERYLFLKL
jgi:hypothetical protein